jgi:hypothetical protein
LCERIRSSFSVSPISKPFHKYYRKAREGGSVQLDDNLFAKSVVAMRLPVSFSAEEATVVLLVMDFVGVVDSVKDSHLFQRRVSFRGGFSTRALL